MAPTQPFRARNFSGEKDEKSSDHRSKSRGGDKSRKDGNDKDRISKSRARSTDKSRTKRRRKHRVVSNLLDGSSNKFSGSEDESDEDMDLNKPLYAIGDYLHNRKELVSNMFSCLKGDTLSRMIPGVLREFSQAELQEKCLYELDGLSRKRIRAILSSKEVLSSSGTDDSEDDEDEKLVENGISGLVSTKEISSRADSGRSGILPALDRDSHRTAAESDWDQEIDLLLDEVDVDVASKDSDDKRDDENLAEGCLTTGPLDIEIVELELRRNALKSMMEQLEDGVIIAAAEDCEIQAGEPEYNKSVTESSSVQSAESESEKELLQIHVADDEMAEFD